MDIPFARKVLEFVEIEHDDFEHEQASFYWDAKFAEEYCKLHPSVDTMCKTSACIAGTACMLAPNVAMTLGSSGMVDVSLDGAPTDWDRAGAQLLGIPYLEAHHLFYTMDEPMAINMLRTMIAKAEAEEAATNVI